jgi:hypothetical protein
MDIGTPCSLCPCKKFSFPEPIVKPVEPELKELEQALKDDASDLWKVTNAIKAEIKSHDWILEGRGSYAWDDDKYKDETRLVFEAVLKLIENVQHPAQLRFHRALALVKKPDYEEWAKANGYVKQMVSEIDGTTLLTPTQVEVIENMVKLHIKRDGLVKLAKDQTLPMNPYCSDQLRLMNCYAQAQKDMADWRKVELEADKEAL